MEKTRVKKGERYWHLNSSIVVVDEIEHNYDTDDEKYAAGNYFNNAEDAEAACENVRKLLKKLHEA